MQWLLENAEAVREAEQKWLQHVEMVKPVVAHHKPPRRKQLPFGYRIWRWSVIKALPGSKHSDAIWLCRCECGNVRSVRASKMRSGLSKSCGCWKREKCISFHTKHGLARTKIYHVWCSMIARCEDPLCRGYRNYGARGIRVCAEWHNFARFFADMGHAPAKGMSIDRIDNNGPYAKANCRWATQKMQMSNARTTARLEYKGIVYTRREFCLKFGLPLSFVARQHRQNKAASTILTLWLQRQ